MSLSDASNDMEEFVAAQNATLSLKLERLERAEDEQYTSRHEKVEEDELDSVDELGSSLFLDRCGPTALYGTTRGSSKKVRTSWDPKDAERNRPDQIVRKLLSSAAGCEFLLEKWAELRSHLEREGGFLVGADRLAAIRMLGRQPIEALGDRRVAEIFTASHALDRDGEPFDDLLSDMGTDEHAHFVKKIRRRYTDLVGHDQPEKARQVLIELVDQNVGLIEAQLEIICEEMCKTGAQRTIDRLGFDDSRRGLLIDQAQMRCRRALDQGIETYGKLKKGKSNGRGPGPGGGGRPRWEEPTRGQRIDDGGADAEIDMEWAYEHGVHEEVEDGQGARGDLARDERDRQGAVNGLAKFRDVSPQPATYADTARQEPRTPGITESRLEIDASDVLARPAAGTKLEILNTKFEGAGNLVCGADVPTRQPAAAAEGGDFVTNEANFDDHVRITQTQEIVGVAVDFGRESGLDRLRTKPFLEGRVDPGFGACSAYNAEGRITGWAGTNLYEGLDEAGDVGGEGGNTVRGP